MNQENVGKIIKDNRIKLGLTQSELGERLGVSHKTISRWENANYMPDISMLIPICNELNITLEELLNSNKVEEEIIEVASNTINKKQKIIYYLEIFILTILLFTLFIMGRKLFIDNYYKNIIYDKDKINCVINKDKVDIIFSNYSPFIYTSNIIEDEENEYIFINGSYDYEGIKRYSEKYINKSIYNEDINSNKNIYVYYTDYNNVFIKNLDNNIKNSILICKSY